MLILIADIYSVVDKFWHLFIKTYTDFTKKILEHILAFVFFFLNIGFNNYINIGIFTQLKLYRSYIFLLFEQVISNFHSIKLEFLLFCSWLKVECGS